MAELTIRLEVDRATGKKNIVVSYESDADALPMEHEQDHRRLVEALLQRGLLTEGELGEVIVERESTSQPRAETQATSESLGAASKKSVGEGS